MKKEFQQEIEILKMKLKENKNWIKS
jgi:hypothetical protein